MITDFEDEVVIVTGGSGQLGERYIQFFLEHGCRVVNIDLIDTALGVGFEADPERYKFFPADITVESHLASIAEALKKSEWMPTILLNNAALDSPPDSDSDSKPFEDYPLENWERVIKVNATGTFLSCKVFGALMSQGSYGRIVNVSSIYGLISPDQSLYQYRRDRGEVFFKPVAYAASKSALLNFTRYLSVYWAKNNITVNTLVISGVFNNQDTEFLKAYESRIPIGRMAKVDDFLSALRFLTSRASSYVTGGTVVVDGGWTAI